MDNTRKFSRRKFVKNTALLGAGALTASSLLAACGDATSTPATASTTAASSSTTAASATTAAGATTASTGATTAASMTTAASATTANAATTAAATGQVVEITHWDWWVTQGPAIDQEIQLFQQANPGIKVKKVTNPSQNFDDAFVLAQKSGDGPDTFLITSKTNGTRDWGNSGYLADLSQFPDFADFKKTFPNPDQAFTEGVNVFKGRVFSAPHDAPFGGMWFQMYVNTKVLKDAGIVDGSGNAKLPVTADDIMSMSQTIKQKLGGKVYGWGWGGKSDFVWGFPLWMTQLSGVDASQDGLDLKTGKYTYGTNPVYAQALQFMAKMRDGGLILPESASIDDEAARALFAEGKFAFLVAGTWVINGWEKTHPNFKDYTITAPPIFGSDTPKSFYYISPGGTLFGINPKSKNAAAAWKWYKWLYSKEAGERWVKTNNGFSIFPDANKPEYIQNEALKNYVKIAPNLVKVGPQVGLRNPDTGLVKLPEIKPGRDQIIQGVFTGQIKDIPQALKDLDAAKQKGLEQAVADAKNAGAKVSTDDWAFSDWDLTKDYTTTAKQ